MEYGLLGKKLGHSFSKEIHAMIGDYDYRLYETDEDGVKELMTKKNFKAINVTIPYKETVMPYLDFISENAKKIGSVNTVVKRGGTLYGYNTDFAGLEGLIKRTGVEIKNKKVLILGTGGTSKTAYAVSKDMGAGEIYKVSRHEGAGGITDNEAYEKHTDATVIINATPVGMYPKNGEKPIDISKFKNLTGVIDVIYNPLETALLKDARERNIKNADGLYMLVLQAVKASELFFDTKYDDCLTDSIFKKVYADKENIVLVGMPSCGKSTIGRIISKNLGREFIDTDSLIVEKYGEISKIFELKGEKYFRNIESQIIAEVSKKNGAVISTGGGAVLRNENIDYLKQNSRIYFLDRAIEKLVPTSDRPLAGTRERIEKLFGERYERYITVCDEKIGVLDDPEIPAKEIERRHYE